MSVQLRVILPSGEVKIPCLPSLPKKIPPVRLLVQEGAEDRMYTLYVTSVEKDEEKKIVVEGISRPMSEPVLVKFSLYRKHFLSSACRETIYVAANNINTAELLKQKLNRPRKWSRIY